MGDRIAGMVLAAGLGTRLAPLTDHLPKPLWPVGGRTLLDRAVDALLDIGCSPVVVNTHHLADRIAGHLAGRTARREVVISHEPLILGTGGALDGARAHLAGADQVVLYNGDVLCSVDLEGLVAAHLRAVSLATLLVTDWPEVNSVGVARDGRVVSIAGRPPASAEASGDAAAERALTYTGIAVLARPFLDLVGQGHSPLVDPLVEALVREPGGVRAHQPPGLLWSDLGTLGRYLEAVAAAPDPGPGAPPGPVEAITGHGSDRRFWRLSVGDWSAVAMLSPRDDPEFDRAAEVARALSARGLGGASVLAADVPGRALLTEDLGPDSLWACHPAWDGDEARWLEAYEPVVDLLLRLQGSSDALIRACPACGDRTLDRGQLRGETEYFQTRFLATHLGLPARDIHDLDGECELLATAVAGQPQVVIHRDFQSQNIHLTAAGPRLVDVQGMRLGPVAYDAMALLWDPYVPLPDRVRRELWLRFDEGVARRVGGRFTEPDLHAMGIGAGLQRIMQALGAYGFLGHVKGKRKFLDHVPRAWDHLGRLLAMLEEARTPGAGNSPWLPPPLPRLHRLWRSASPPRTTPEGEA
ncbi:MAG: sugar phosphate nucleotidyltransferase [Candidatus Krumholzibacteriia bacterium]